MFFSGDEVKRFAQQVDVGTLNLCFLGPSASSFSSHLTRFHVGIWVDVKRKGVCPTSVKVSQAL